MSSIELLHKALLNLKATGSDGFEGLVRDCIESVANRNFRLVKSGPQQGKDFKSDPIDNLPVIVIESKRFGATSSLPLDALKSKLREALECSPRPDIWGLALSREMKQPDWDELERIGREQCATLLCLDWREEKGSLPALAVLCCSAKHICISRLEHNLTQVFSLIEAHPDYEWRRTALRDLLTSPRTGFDLARDAAMDWLESAVSSESNSRRRLHNHADILCDNANLIARPVIEASLDDWWVANDCDIAALIGDEGCGKTWVAIKWSLSFSDSEASPLVCFVSAQDIHQEDLGNVISRALYERLSLPAMSDVNGRLSRWLQPNSTNKILLLIDGLNERWDYNWHSLVDQSQVEPWKGKVKLLLTSRKGYWRDNLLELQGANIEAVPRINVPKFSDAELDKFLKEFGLIRSELSRGLLELIRIPRFASLAIRLREQLNNEDVIPARLVLEDWRSRLRERELKVQNEELLNFIAKLGEDVLGNQEFTISVNGIHKYLSADSGFSLEHYRADISEIVEGNWLVATETPHRFRINDSLLPYVIGLDLDRSLFGLTSRAELEEVIAHYSEQLRGSDISVAILRAATTIGFLQGRAEDIVLEVLLESWLGCQNFGSLDFEEMWPLISRKSDIFLIVGEKFWKKEPLGSSKSEVLVKGFANAVKWPEVQQALIDCFPKWVGSFSLDPASSFYGDSERKNTTRIQKTERNIDIWKATEKEYSLDISKNFRIDAQDWLSEAAFSIISFVKREPFFETFITWGVVRSISGVTGGSPLHWVLRFNLEDCFPTQRKLLLAVEELGNLSCPIALEAGCEILRGIASPEAIEKIQSTPEIPKAPFPISELPHIDANHLITWVKPGKNHSYILESLSKFAINPNARLSENLRKCTNAMTELTNNGEFSDMDSIRYRGSAISSFCRWLPGQYANVIRAAIKDSPYDGEGMGFRGEEYTDEPILLLDSSQRATLLSKMLVKLEDSNKGKNGTENLRLQNLIVVATSGCSASQQIEVLKRLLPELRFDATYSSILATFGKSDLHNIFDMLINEKNEQSIAVLLHLIGSVGWNDLPDNIGFLIDLARSKNTAIRSPAMDLIRCSKSEKLCKEFIDSAWSYAAGQENMEAICGSYIVSDYGKDLDFDQARSRIIPQALPYLVQARGCISEEVDAAYEYLDSMLDELIGYSKKTRSGYPHIFRAEKVWHKIVEKDAGTIIRKTKQAIYRERPLGMFNVFPVVELLEAVIDVDPKEGVEIWRKIKEWHRKNGVTTVDFDALRFVKTNSPETNELLRSSFEEAINDAEISDLAFKCLENQHEEWLIELIKQYLCEDEVRYIALGLTISAFLDSTQKAKELWRTEISPARYEEWLLAIKNSAWENFQKNTFARYWFEKYISSNNEALAYDYYRIFSECADDRTSLWVRETADIHRQVGGEVDRKLIEYFEVKKNSRKSQRDRIKNNLKKSLYFTKTESTLSPWA